eukprot:9483173-Pyramimonas_sp.AAC.1
MLQQIEALRNFGAMFQGGQPQDGCGLANFKDLRPTASATKSHGTLSAETLPMAAASSPGTASLTPVVDSQGSGSQGADAAPSGAEVPGAAAADEADALEEAMLASAKAAGSHLAAKADKKDTGGKGRGRGKGTTKGKGKGRGKGKGTKPPPTDKGQVAQSTSKQAVKNGPEVGLPKGVTGPRRV